jgi:hypothetical protein
LSGQQAFDQPFAGEISLVRRGRQPLIEVVPTGKRRIPFDLPADMINAARFMVQLVERNPTISQTVSTAAPDLERLSDPVTPPEPVPDLRTYLQEIANCAERQDDRTGRLMLGAAQAALRSNHLAVLSRLWLDSVDHWFEAPFWRRRATRTLKDAFYGGHAGVGPPQVERIRYLLGSMEIREPTETWDTEPTNQLLVAAALAASVGLLPRPQTWYRLVRSNSYITALVESIRIYPVRADSPGTISSQYVQACHEDIQRQLTELEFAQVPLLKGIRLSN